MAMTAPPTYSFGNFRLDPAARGLWRRGELIELPRLAFRALTLLVENRDRAVGREELIGAVWGKPYVEDVQLTQLIMRLRRALGDDSQEPRFIRTVSGFGYHWIAETEELPAQPPNGSPADGEPRRAAAADAVPSGVEPLAQAPAISRGRGPRPRQVLVSVALALVLAVVAWNLLRPRRPPASQPSPRPVTSTVAVLPLEVHAPRDADADWVRLGAMDLIAARLRDSGLPVSPSDGVISALHADAELPAAERLRTLRSTLGAGVVVQGAAKRTAGGWTIALTATGAANERWRVESGPGTVLAAADSAAELLLASLGRPVPAAGDGGDASLEELLQRARAATLALELDAARTLLIEAPRPLRQAPEVRHALAWVEFRAGRHAEAAAIAAELLAEPAVRSRPRLYARTLTLRGIVASRERGDWTVGEPDFDAAVAALDGEPWALELGEALAVRGYARAHRQAFDAAARDLGRARVLFEAAGDRLGLARVHNYSANLEMQRRRPVDAVPHFEAAIEISEAYGHVDWLRGSLVGLLVARAQLLRWPQALAASECLEALRDRIPDPAWRDQIRILHAVPLIGLGRHGEAETALATPPASATGTISSAARNREEARAELAWQRGRPAAAMRAAAQALELWSASEAGAEEPPPELALLHQRASIAAGRPVPAARTLHAAAAEIASWERGTGSRVAEPEEEEATASEPKELVAAAEWAAFRGDPEAAERLFQQAAAGAEAGAVPADLVLVADAHGRWLLAEGRISEAVAVAGRVAPWAEQDYDAALLQVAVLHASGRRNAWATALRRARRLAGERAIPPELSTAPGETSDPADS